MYFYTQVQPFIQAVARVGNDFISATGASLNIPEGSSAATIPITIVGDTTPELNESLIVTITEVELVGAEGENLASEPQLGAITEATVVIVVNDDPHGKFFLFSSNGESVFRVREAENFGVLLTIERQGGTLGDVQVSWTVTGGTAVEGEDYTGECLLQAPPTPCDCLGIHI